MRVLFECRSIHPGKSGGIENYLYMLVNAWEKNFPNDEIILHIPPNTSDKYLKKVGSAIILKTDPVYQRANDLANKYRSISLLIRCFSRLNISGINYIYGLRKKWIKYLDAEADVVIYPFQRELFVHDPKKTIFVMHDFREFDSKDGKKKIIKEQIKALNNAAKIVVSWPYPYNRLNQLFPQVEYKTKMIPFLYNPFDVERISGKVENYLYYPSANAEHKNHETLIKAIAIVNRNRKEKIKLICSGPINESRGIILEKLIKEEKIQEQVKFIGFVDREQVNELYQNCLAVITSTKYEAFSGAILEAFRYMKPVIASQIPSIEQFLDFYNINIQLFDPNDPVSIAESIEITLANYDLNISRSISGNNALKNITPFYTISKFRDLAIQIVTSRNQIAGN